MCELGIDFVETLILALPEIPDDEQLSALKGFWEVCFLKKDRYQIINVLCNYMIVYWQITLHFICCVTAHLACFLDMYQAIISSIRF